MGPRTQEEWWDEDAARLDILAEAATASGAVIDVPLPDQPELDEYGAEVDDGDDST